jgi:hypothetical protein
VATDHHVGRCQKVLINIRTKYLQKYHLLPKVLEDIEHLGKNRQISQPNNYNYAMAVSPISDRFMDTYCMGTKYAKDYTRCPCFYPRGKVKTIQEYPDKVTQKSKL